MNGKFFISFREKKSMILTFSSIIEAMTFVFFTFWGLRNNRYASCSKTIKASLLLKLEKFFLKLFIIMALVKTFFSNTRVQKHFRIKTHLGMSESLRLRLRSHSLMWTTCDYWIFTDLWIFQGKDCLTWCYVFVPYFGDPRYIIGEWYWKI